MSVAFVIGHAVRMRRIILSSVACLTLPYSSTLLLLLLLFTAIGFSPGGSSPYTSTHNTNVFTRWQ
jgi:hypothetical protein